MNAVRDIFALIGAGFTVSMAILFGWVALEELYRRLK